MAASCDRGCLARSWLSNLWLTCHSDNARSSGMTALEWQKYKIHWQWGSICYGSIPNHSPASKPVNQLWSGSHMKHHNEQISRYLWSAHEVLARRTVALMTMSTVDQNPNFIVYGTPLHIFLTVGLTCTFRGDKQALLSKSVAPHVSTHLSFKDEGSVLMFCVPVLFLCSSVPYGVWFDEKAWEVI